MERRHPLGPDDALVVVAGLDDGADKAAHADAVAAHVHRDRLAVRPLHGGAHRLGILGAEVEDLAHLDAARAAAARLRHLVEDRLVMGLVGAGVKRGELLHHRLALRLVVIVDVARAEADIGHRTVIEHLRLAGLGQHQEFMGIVAADRPAVGAHRDRLQPHPLIGAQVADQMAVIGVQRVFLRQVEVVAVLHEELAPAHHAKARADLVAELPLDVIECQRQILVAADMGAEDVGDHLLVGRPIEHIAVVPVADAQHFLAVIVVAAALAPQVGRLDGRHQHFLDTGPVLLLAHDLLDLAQHLETQRQPGIDAGAGLADHAGPQHETVRDDLRLGGVLLERGKEILRQSHRKLILERNEAAAL